MRIAHGRKVEDSHRFLAAFSQENRNFFPNSIRPTSNNADFFVPIRLVTVVVLYNKTHSEHSNTSRRLRKTYTIILHKTRERAVESLDDYKSHEPEHGLTLI